MTNPASTSRAPEAPGTHTPSPRTRRRSLARVMPAVTCILACVLLGAAAAADGGAAALVLGTWVVLLAAIGLRMTRVGPIRQAPPPQLTLAPLDEDGGIGVPSVVRLVPTRTAARVVRMRPRG